MKLILMTIAAAIVLSGCTRQFTPSPVVQSSPSHQLTTEKAQDAIDRFVSANGSGGRLQIRGGVREVPSENAAIAELNVEDFVSNNRIYKQNKWRGQAIFSKYSDGRWGLSEIKLTNPSDYAWQSWKPVIDVH